MPGPRSWEGWRTPIQVEGQEGRHQAQCACTHTDSAFFYFCGRCGLPDPSAAHPGGTSFGSASYTHTCPRHGEDGSILPNASDHVRLLCVHDLVHRYDRDFAVQPNGAVDATGTEATAIHSGLEDTHGETPSNVQQGQASVTQPHGRRKGSTPADCSRPGRGRGELVFSTRIRWWSGTSSLGRCQFTVKESG